MNQSIFPSPNKTLINIIQKAENAIIIGHKNPDGDALSSSIALKKILISLNKEAVVLNDGPIERKELKFMAKEISSFVPPSFTSENTVVIIVDCSTEDRPGESYKKVSNYKNVVVIDHHASGVSFVKEDKMFLVPSSPSTTILIDILREKLDAKLTEEIAFYLYIGLLTDTGFFHFISRSVAPEVFSRATEFVKKGLDPYSIYDLMNDGKDLEEIKDVCKIILSSEVYFSGKLIIATQSEDMYKKRLSDVVYQELLKAQGVLAVVFFKPQKNETEIGFRCKRNSGLDVGKIAENMGGGGHKFASGATVIKTLEDAKKYVLDLFSVFLED